MQESDNCQKTFETHFRSCRQGSFHLLPLGLAGGCIRSGPYFSEPVWVPYEKHTGLFVLPMRYPCSQYRITESLRLHCWTPSDYWPQFQRLIRTWRQLYKNRSSRKIDSQRLFSRVGIWRNLPDQRFTSKWPVNIFLPVKTGKTPSAIKPCYTPDGKPQYHHSATTCA